MARKMAGGAVSLVMGMVSSTAARAGEPCGRLDAPPSLPLEWARAAEELGQQLSRIPPADCQPMALSLQMAEGAARIVAVTPDGRRAERTVRDPRSLVAMGLGLVMAIPAPREAARTPANDVRPALPAPTAGPVSAPVSPPQTPATAADASPPADTHLARTTVSLGFAAGGRVAAPTSILTLDIEAYANVLLGPWLLMASIRDVPTGFVAAQGIDEDAFREVSAGLGFGRRVFAGDAMIDLAVEPALVAMQMEYDFPAGSRPSSVHGNDIEFGLDAIVRMSLPLGKSWAFTLTMDLDVMPSNIISPARLDVPPQGALTGAAGANMPPPFPALTSGLRLGASGVLL